MAVIYRDSVKCTPVDVGDYSQFESLAVKVVVFAQLQAYALSIVYCVRRTNVIIPVTVASILLSRRHQSGSQAGKMKVPGI